MIKKIKMINYKMFKHREIFFNEHRNILVGENGVGKSSILNAISLVLSGSLSMVDKIGLQSLFNVEVIKDFLNSDKKYKDLPQLLIELYFTDDTEVDNYHINGKLNTDKVTAYGLKLIVKPNDNYTVDIKAVLAESSVFPFEYYHINFETFSGKVYHSFSKKHSTKYELIDSSAISINYAISKFVSQFYCSHTSLSNRQRISHDFRQVSNSFSNKLYSDYEVVDDSEYKLIIKTNSENLEQQYISMEKDNLSIDNLGLGNKLLIGLESTLANCGGTDITLVEEPENHLSPLNMHKLIDMIEKETNSQLFISTHSNMVATRLELSNVIFMNKIGSVCLSDLSNETMKFFQKAPNTNVLNFILSPKVILVEGDAEYILLNKFYEIVTGHNVRSELVEIISCGGKTFKRYVELTNKLDKRIAIITDNDRDYYKNVQENYKEFISENISVFSPTDNDENTFEVSLYKGNTEFFETKIKTSYMKNGVLDYSLSNKAESAFRVLMELEGDINIKFKVPDYIIEAIQWIRQ